MMGHSSRSLPVVILLLAGFWIGCSTTPTATLHSPYFFSRDRGFQYRLPMGWYDASADSQSAGHAVWLLRDDYAATIAVNELHIDVEARRDLEEGGIMHLATVSMALAAAGKPYILEQAPQTVRVNGKAACVYELMTSPASDALRVILVDTGRKVYMITALVSGESKQATRDGVFSVQDAFLNSLRW